MDRLACVDLPAFPLQVLLLAHPEWAGWPAVVVDDDKPQGLVLWVNNKARDGGVLPGHRYGAALSLVPTLRAGTITPQDIDEGVERVLARLRNFSPDVEPSRQEPGVFWLDAGGLERMFASSEVWANELRQDLQRAGFLAGVVVGFRRFGTYAAARALRGRKALVFDTPELEDEVARGVPLALIGLSPAIRDNLDKLAIRRVGDLLGLPAHGLGKRFGPEAVQLHRFASGDLDLPLNPTPVEELLEEHLELGYRESNAERLVFAIKPLVDRLLFALGQRGLALTELQLRLELDDAPARLDCIRTAEPTLSSVTVMELVKLRLDAGPLVAPAVGAAVTASSVPATEEQLRLFAEAPRRDLAAAARAFARLRAAFASEDVVARAVLRDRHSPEGSFGWEPMHAIERPHPRPEAAGTLVRRFFAQAVPLPHQPRRSPDGWLLRGPTYGPVEHASGPYRLTGGWWRQELQRDYYFTELHRGDLCWVYYDRIARRWFLQGEVT